MLETLALLAAAAAVQALPRPQLMCSSAVVTSACRSSASASTTTTSTPRQSARSPFSTTDVSSTSLEQTMLKTALGVLRGGAVLEHTTLADVEATLLRAGSENKLVVIDFSAVWCGPCKMIAPLVREICHTTDTLCGQRCEVDDAHGFPI
jgi:thiol-disulfide isomerase/thioredoxin